MPIFAWNVSLVSLVFLTRSLVFPILLFSYFFALITEEGFLISPCYSLELCIQICISHEWWLMNYGHCTQCEVICHYSFGFYFYNDWWSEHIFLCLLVICMYSLEKCLIRSSAHFWFSCFVCYWVVLAVCIFWKVSTCWFHCLQILSPFVWVFFSFGLWLPLWCKCL